VGLQDNSPANKPQEKQEERDARVKRVQIYPGDVSVGLYERVAFAAVAYDADGNPVGGVSFSWSAQDEGHNNQATRISKRGEFEARVSGTFKVTVEAGGKKDHVKVTVLDGERRRRGEKPGKGYGVSTLDDRPEIAAAAKPRNKGRRARGSGEVQFANASFAPAAAAPAPEPVAARQSCGDAYRWNRCNYPWGDDPVNRRGRRPGQPEDQGAGNGNFQISAPVLALAGRGIDISLNLVYNSHVWSKNNTNINYDIDQDWPAAGWSVGFGRIVGLGYDKGGMIVEADGTRHGFKGGLQPYSTGVYGTLHSVDGTFIDYNTWTNNSGVILSATARYPNGTVIQYGAPGSGSIYPTQVQDANGNYLTITYVNNVGPNIQTITDTLGRVVNFYYDANGLLTAITGPGLNGGTRTLVRLKYKQLPWLNAGFVGLTPMVRNYTPWAVEAIYYPSTNTGYWFGDTDSYISYGMISKVVEQRGMGFSASSLNDQGTVTPGTATRQQVYNFLQTGLTDAPTFNTVTETFDGMDTAAAVTQYEVFENSSPRKVTVTLPNLTKSIQYSYNSPNTYLDGLAYRDEIKDNNGNLLQSTDTAWQQGVYDSPRPVSISFTDERSQKTGIEFSYGANYNQVTEARVYDYGYVYGGYSNVLLRRSVTQYHDGAGYVNNHVFSLPTRVEIYNGAGTRMAQTDYQYDGATPPALPDGTSSLQDLPTTVAQHYDSHNPFAPQTWNEGYWEWECDEWGYCYQRWVDGYYTTDYQQGTDYRGNVTQVTSYADAVGLAGATTLTRRFDITGNAVSGSTSCCEQTSLTYTQGTQYAYPEAKTRGSVTDAFAQVKITGTFDFNTGLVLTNRDENNRPSWISYDANSLRPAMSVLPTNGRTEYAYNDAAMTVTTTAFLAVAPVDTGAVAMQSVKYLNGLGQVKQEKALGANGVWDYVDIKYDEMGRLWQQTRAYRAGDTKRWSTITYDALSREAAVELPDTSRVEITYNAAARPDAATTDPGQTVKIKDQWDRERWGRVNSSGRLVEVVEANPGGGGSVATGGLRTTYTYDALGRLTGTTQGGQTRAFAYDSLGRLTKQKLAETTATLNDAGVYVGAGGAGAQWSDFFAYDGRSNLVQRVDARGVKTNFSYKVNNLDEPLNRLQSISYDLSGPHESLANSPINAAATVSYSYRTKNNSTDLVDVTQVASVTAGSVTEAYTYDSEGRVGAKTLTVNGRPQMRSDYTYDSLNRAKDLLYPAQNLAAQTQRKSAHVDYDVASRVSRLQFNGQDYASSIDYNAASQITSMQVGWAGSVTKREEYDYDPATGLLTAQRVLRNGTTQILNLQYNYLRAGTTAGRTGQLTSVTDAGDSNKNRTYEYDALGRLKRATGGQNVNWAERYDYDRYGNRLGAYSQSAEYFVRNFYQSGLGRQPNSSELQQGVSSLQAAYAQGQSQMLTQARAVGDTVFNSSEYAARNRTNQEFVYDLYKTYLNREPDQGGWNFWTGQVAANGRAAVRNAFATCSEFDLNVQGISPNSPPGGVAVPADGIGTLSFDSNTNRVNWAGYEYDAAGNQTRTQAAPGVWQRYEYDAAGRLVKVKNDAGTVLVTYTYGVGSRRLVADGGGARTYYVWEGGSVIMEYQENAYSPTTPQWTKSYVYMGARLLSTLAPNGAGGEAVQFHHQDRLGTRLITNAADNGATDQATLPFGTALAAETSPTGASSRRFTSYDRDAVTNLDNAVSRHYDSTQGRFTQVDPLGMGAVSLSSPQTLNLYAYCGNDPVNHVDPDGQLFGFIGKIFKGIAKLFKALWKWSLKVVQVTAKVALKLLASKIGRILISIAIVLLLGPGAPLTWALLAETEGPNIGITATAALLAGVQAAGAVAAHVEKEKEKEKKDKKQKDRPKEVKGGSTYQRVLLEEALQDLVNRIHNNPDCAKLFGGEDKALKALSETTIEFKDLGKAIPIHGPGGQIVGFGGPTANAQTNGKVVQVNTNGTFSEGGQITLLGMGGSGMVVDLAGVYGGHEGIVHESSETLAHELAHRTNTIPRDGPNDPNYPNQSPANDEKVRAACGY
jgi:RHS repeat-associated protein